MEDTQIRKCAEGHELAGANIYRVEGGKWQGRVRCRICMRKADAIHRRFQRTKKESRETLSELSVLELETRLQDVREKFKRLRAELPELESSVKLTEELLRKRSKRLSEVRDQSEKVDNLLMMLSEILAEKKAVKDDWDGPPTAAASSAIRDEVSF